MTEHPKISALILIVMFACLLTLSALAFSNQPKYKIYDCSIAEWHPDYPAKVREQCRRLQGKKVLTLSLNNNIIV
jgi:hypothetical protein